MPKTRTDLPKWWILSAMGGVLALVLLDETILGVALPTIRQELSLTDVASHWVVNSYLLVFAGLVAVGGRLGDILGLRRLFTLGILIFGGASLACGLTGDGNWLIGLRGVQGIGAAVIFPASMAMISIVFPEEERGTALGIYGAIGTIGLTLGPLVGGTLTEIISWRWIFWINLPVVLLVMIIVLVYWREPPMRRGSDPFDFAGMFSLTGGLGLLVFALMEGPEWGWNHMAIWLCLIAGVLLSATFIWIEMRESAPLIDVALFANKSFSACNLVVFIAQFGKIAVFIFAAAWLQRSIGMTAIEAGLALLASVIPGPVAAPMAGRLADRFGARRPIFFGLVTAAVAFAWIALAMQWESYLALVPAFILWGIALPFMFAPPMRAIMNSVPLEKQGLAGGIVLSAQLLGGTVGMTLCSALYVTLNDYAALFLMTGILTALVLILAMVSVTPEGEIPEAKSG